MLKKLLAGVTALALSLGMIALVAGPASAHTGDLNVSAVCNTATGNYDFTATLVISQTNEVGSTKWKIGTTTFTGTPTSNSGLNLGPVASNGAQTITLGTWTMPGSTTGLGPWVYAFTTWTPDNYTKGSDGRLYQALDGSCGDTPDSQKITFCHWDGGSGKYSVLTTSLSAFYTSGHIDHSNDVYPAGSIVKQGVTHSWSAQGNQSQLQYSDCLIPITPAAPSFVDAVCTGGHSGNGSYTIPTTTGVSYYVNGSSTAKPAGTYSVTPVATISIVAKLTASNKTYELTGTTSWSHDFASAGTCKVTPAAPSVTDQVCTVNGDGNGVYTSGYITIPSTAHVQYKINGSNVSAGQNNLAPGTYTVTAVGTDGYSLSSYPSGGWSLTIHSALSCGNVTPAAPSVTDQVCSVNSDGNGVYTSGYITIPSSTKVNYFINGVAASAGNHNRVPGTYTVTATAVPNYTLVGYPSGGWSLTIHSALACGNVTPAAPSVTDQLCSVDGDGNGVYTSGYITIPSSTKVDYFINGVAASAGNHNEVPGTYTVTATPTAAYTLTGYPSGGWSLTIDSANPCGNITPTPPSVTDESCTVDGNGDGSYTSGTITIPSTANVSYFIDGTPVTAGSYDYAPGTYTVTAVATPDYTLVGYPVGGWSETIESSSPCGDVTPVEPTVTDQTCAVNVDGKGTYTEGTITIPSTPNVNYFVDGVAVSAGSHDYAPGTYTVTATAVPDYTLVGYPDGGWSETISAALPCGNVSPVDPIVVDQSCVVDDNGAGSYVPGYIDLPASSTVTYFIDGSPAGTHNELAPGTYQVTAEAIPNYTLVGYPDGGWSETINAAEACGDLVSHPIVTPIVTSVQLTCTAGGSYTLSNDLSAADGVIWTVNGSPVLQGTYAVTTPTTVTVHAEPNAPAYGFTFGQQQDWTLVFAAATTCDLTTLALTGSDPVGGMLLAYFMLLAGIGIITVRSVSRHGRPQE
jgi:hypothetical protein